MCPEFQRLAFGLGTEEFPGRDVDRIQRAHAHGERVSSLRDDEVVDCDQIDPLQDLGQFRALPRDRPIVEVAEQPCAIDRSRSFHFHQTGRHEALPAASGTAGPGSLKRRRKTALASTYLIRILLNGAQGRLDVNGRLEGRDLEGFPVLRPRHEASLLLRPVTPGCGGGRRRPDFRDRIVPVAHDNPGTAGSFPEVPAQVGLQLADVDVHNGPIVGPS